MDILSKAGVLPDILILCGWLFAAVLILILLYNLFYLAIKLLTRRRN